MANALKALILAVCSILLLALLLVGQMPLRSKCEDVGCDNGKRAQQNQQDAGQSPAVLNAGQPPKEEQPSHSSHGSVIEGALEIWRETWTKPEALWAFCVAFFTAGLTVSTGFLWFSTRRAAKIAERALTELEVPFIGLKILDPGITVDFTVNQPILSIGERIRFCFTNYGRTPATLMGLKTDLRTCRAGNLPVPIWESEFAKRYPPGVLVGADRDSAPSTRYLKRSLSDEEIDAIRDQTADLFLIGRLRYDDIFGNRYLMGFCAVFDKESGGFLMKGDKRYNYKEKRKPRSWTNKLGLLPSLTFNDPWD
jgi:hypothetical protein